MDKILEFSNRLAFRSWLETECLTHAGVWLLFGKAGGPKTITANEALEEALCFGWIDAQMQSLDEKTYQKYFSPRRENSKWSEKNKALAMRLEQQGSMTDYGRAKIAQAKQHGQWDAAKAPGVTVEQIAAVAELLGAMSRPIPIFRPCRRRRRKPIPGRGWMPRQTPGGKSVWRGWWSG